MVWTEILLPGVIVWLVQLIISDLLAIGNVRPDFMVILVLYWSVKNGRFFGIISGTIAGLIIDLTGSAMFFGLSPLIYSITGYLGGNLHGANIKLNTLYFSISWITILLFQFLIFCAVHYQSVWVIDQQVFLGKWFGTSFYTIGFTGILQFIYPLNKVD